MRRLIYLVLVLVVVGLGCAGSGYWIFSNFTRDGPLKDEMVIIVRSGSGIYAIAQELVL